ncbi:Glucan 1,3-beta-glucosidase [Bertholletia excelsa]
MDKDPIGLYEYVCGFIIPLSQGRDSPNLKIKAVNLGGWLVTEGWIKPSLFDGIPNKDFLDGRQLQFKSVTVGKYLCAESGGGTILVANRSTASGWETFKLWRINKSRFRLRVFNKQFVGLDATGGGNQVVAVVETPGKSETFEIVRNSTNETRVRIKASNGLFLQVKTEELVTVDSKGDGDWGDDDPSVFIITFIKELQGEFQVTNGYGPEKAPQVMQDHWNTFIVEDDFKFISSHGINAVRVPVGWWIASDPNPPRPYVGGSLKALDNAFTWAQKYGLKVIIDLHAAPGSQNGFEHSSSRDGFAKNPSLYAVELINEPLAPGVSLDIITKYYKAGYDTVRKHSPTVYVIWSNRLSGNSKELLAYASGLQGTVIDIHYYNLFSGVFDSMTVQQNIDFVRNNRSMELNQVTTSNGPLTFVGEWTAEWQVQGASKADYQNFARAQLQVYGRASFGWAYWTLKNVNNHWSLNETLNNDKALDNNIRLQCIFICFMLHLSHGRETQNSKVRAVNPGGWLDTEGWIKPSLFAGIPNKSFRILLQFKSAIVGKYPCADAGIGQQKVINKTFVGLDAAGDSNRVEGFDPTIQTMAQKTEAQRTKAHAVEDHRDMHIAEDDFKFISSNGVNAMTFLVGLWIVSDPNPPKPHVSGSLEALDSAFPWAYDCFVKRMTFPYFNRRFEDLLAEWPAQGLKEGLRFAQVQLDVYHRLRLGGLMDTED